jgi:(p)ppGpp synthase/HD superfamily hydrolase
MVLGKASVPLLFPASKGAVMAANPRWVPSPAFLKAFEAACLAHGQDARKINREPYIGHLMGVASLVIEHNGTQEQAIAALLHDIIEDSPMTFDELEFEFGPAVRKIVEACTDATYEQKAIEKAKRTLSDEDKKDETKKAAAQAAYEKDWWHRKEGYLKRLKKKDHNDPSVLVALADKVNNGEKTALDLEKSDDEGRKKFRESFNTGYALQQQWYEGLVKAFAEALKDCKDPLVLRLQERFANAVKSMFSYNEK